MSDVLKIVQPHIKAFSFIQAEIVKVIIRQFYRPPSLTQVTEGLHFLVLYV